MDTEQLSNKIRMLEGLSRGTVLSMGHNYSTFASRTTQQSYSIHGTDPILIRPILKLKDIVIVENTVNTHYLKARVTQEDVIPNTLNLILNANEEVNVENALAILVTQVYSDDTAIIKNELVDNQNYEDLFKKHTGLKEIFTSNIYSGATIAPTESTRDFIELELLKRKDSNELVFIANYALNKRYQDKQGLLSVGDRPQDSNSLVLLGLLPAFIPALKEKLTEQELELFKLLTTPVKLYHERSSAALFEKIITEPVYATLVRNQKIEELRERFRQQEAAMFTDNISRTESNITQLVERLRDAEVNLIQLQKEYTYYQNGESKLEDAVNYIFEHAYLINVDVMGTELRCTFRVPLSQWDLEITETILNGIKKDPSKYGLQDRTLIKAVQDFMQYILIEQVAKYWILAEFVIELNSLSYSIVKAYTSSFSSFNPVKLNIYNAGVNPHLEYHSCTGSYRVQIERAQQRKDLSGLVESILAPYKNWNLADGTVQNKMFNYALPGLLSYNVACIEYNGELLGLRTFLDKINAERNPAQPVKPVVKKRTRKRTVTPDDTVDATRFAEFATEQQQVHEHILTTENINETFEQMAEELLRNQATAPTELEDL